MPNPRLSGASVSPGQERERGTTAICYYSARATVTSSTKKAKSSEQMNYRQKVSEAFIQELRTNNNRKLTPYTDFFHGQAYLETFQYKDRDGNAILNPDDITLTLSIDGAQLYRNKVSDCTIYIWIVMDLPPEIRYRKDHVLLGGFIPGPNKPKVMDSFIFPGLYHLSALQRHGLKMWDALKQMTVTSFPFLSLATADAPGMAAINRFVGHQGRVHCRLYCPLVGRHKPEMSSYYPALQKP